MSVDQLPPEGGTIFGRKAGPDYVVDDNGCWIWQKALFNGYAVARGRVHRTYYKLAHGDDALPDDHDLHHKCRNTACINPDHLVPLLRRVHDIEHFLGDHGRDFDLIRQVRAERQRGATYRQLAAKYGLTYDTARNWCLALTWAGELGAKVGPPDRVCAREDCDNVFNGRPHKRFCSSNCRGVHNQRLRMGYKPRQRKTTALNQEEVQDA